MVHAERFYHCSDAAVAAAAGVQRRICCTALMLNGISKRAVVDGKNHVFRIRARDQDLAAKTVVAVVVVVCMGEGGG